YGLCYCVLFAVFERLGVPTLYDKLLPLPFLNLSVKLIDRFARSGLVGRFARWEAAFPLRRMNLVHMACWAAIFIPMMATGYVGAPQPGSSIPFWKKVVAQGGRDGPRGLLTVARFQAQQGSAEAWNELGLISMEGRIVNRSPAAAVECFAKASALGSLTASKNLVTQFFQRQEMEADADIELALDRLEKECSGAGDGSCFHLVGLAYEAGRGRRRDPERARLLYQQGCVRGSMDACKGAVRVQMQ
ncbi:MAG TPA: hypothetical protein VK824_03575, partial [Planctomycetota bacterium]|nr:hypothetical protein [Planctomycetota bacterium]